MTSQYRQMYEGEWGTPPAHEACCDCGLVHRVEYSLVSKRLEIRKFRDNRRTGQVRRRMRERGELRGRW